jgi:hypothetical protein
MDFAQAFSYLFAAVEVFIDVAGEDSVNRRLSQESQVRSGGRNTAHVGVRKTFQTLFIDIDGYFRSRLDVIDEVTKAGAQVKSHPVGPDVALQIPANRPPKFLLLDELGLSKAQSVQLRLYHRHPFRSRKATA